MIRLIEGYVKYKNIDSVILKTKFGIGYEILLSTKSIEKIEISQEIEFFITQIIREDANLLFGFLDKNEQDMFEALKKVNGIGPITALNVCSALSYSEFLQALDEQDEEAFKKVNKIGAKGAKKLIAELSDYKFLRSVNHSNCKKEASLALSGLGFDSKIINEVLSRCESKDTKELIKEALQRLGK